MARKSKKVSETNEVLAEMVEASTYAMPSEQSAMTEHEPTVEEITEAIENWSEIPAGTEDIDAAEAEMFALAISGDMSADVAIEVHETEAVQIAEAPQSFKELIDAVTPEQRKEMCEALKREIDERHSFESVKNPTTYASSMASTLKTIEKALVRDPIAAVLIAAGVSADFLNKGSGEGSRYSAYAILKLADIASGLSGAAMTNKVNLACMKSLFAMKAAGLPFKSETARAATCDKLRIDAAIAKHLIRHTVSVSTANTQASSTMQAARTLGIVSQAGRDAPFNVLDTPQASALEQRYAPIAA